MTERRQFPPPPGKTNVLNRDGTMALGWLEWFGVLTAWVQRVRVIPGSYDWPSIAAGATAAANFTITGAAVGDFVTVSLDPTSEDIAATGQVTAADTVTVRLVNYGAGAVDLASGTTRIRLERAR